MGMGGNNEGSKQGSITYYQTKKGIKNRCTFLALTVVTIRLKLYCATSDEQFELDKAKVVKQNLDKVGETDKERDKLLLQLDQECLESKDTTESKHYNSGSTLSSSGRSGTNGYDGRGGSS
ncbi:hypothetical protein Tco_0829875 [Tanacetum coccineum]